MYGSLPSSIKYPEERGKGILLETLACIRMLSIFFDLPFRKDVIHKILAEQINKSSEEFLIVEQIAAIIDFVGLRSTFLEPNSKDLLERIQLPALILIKNQSSILWEINDGIFIQSDPVRGQRKISSKEIFNLAKEDSVKILTIEKNIYTPKSRFGLSWFIPSKLSKFIRSGGTKIPDNDPNNFTSKPLARRQVIKHRPPGLREFLTLSNNSRGLTVRSNASNSRAESRDASTTCSTI